MYIGEEFAENIFIDALGNCNEEITIDENGNGVFKVNAKSVSVWVRK